MDLGRLDGSLVEANNLEGNTIGAWLRNGYGNDFIANAGEGVGPAADGHTNPFYRVGDAAAATTSSSNKFTGGDCRFAGGASADGVWIDFARAGINSVEQLFLVDTGVSSVRKAHVITGGVGSGNRALGGFYTDWTAID